MSTGGITMAALAKRKERLVEEIGAAWPKVGELENQIAVNEAVLMQITMLELAEANPAIESFTLDANSEYDDEGGYFWAASYRADGEKYEELDDFECEPISDASSERSAEIVFGSKWEGTVTVEDLRKELLA